jgi:hypothetical protein
LTEASNIIGWDDLGTDLIAQDQTLTGKHFAIAKALGGQSAVTNINTERSLKINDQSVTNIFPLKNYRFCPSNLGT